MTALISAKTRDYIWPVLLMGIVHALSSTSELATPDLSFAISPDKIGHFLVFGLIATSILRIPYFSKRGMIGWLSAALLVMCYGGLDEWRQSMTPGRAVEFADWLADCAGALVATSVYYYWPRYRNFLEYRFEKSLRSSSSEAA